MHKRIFYYLNEMYPPIPRLLMAILITLGIQFMYQISHQIKIEITYGSIAGIATTFFLLLFLRVSDEIKDYEVDKKLFPDRMVAQGKIELKDIKFLWYVSLIIASVINIIWFNSLFIYAILITFSLLMYKYFFLPQYISKSLILALVTHNPVGLIMNFYLISSLIFL